MGSLQREQGGLPRALSSTLFVRMRGSHIGILPCSSNERSVTPALRVFGFKFSWRRDSRGSRRSFGARAISWSSHFRLNPVPPMWTPRTPARLVPIGKVVCGLPRRASEDSAIFNGWWLVGESSWSSPQSSTSWGTDEAPLDVPGWGRFATLGGRSLGRAHFPPLEGCRFAPPPDLFFQTQTLGFLPS